MPVPCRHCDLIADELAKYIGPHMARNAVRTFAGKALGRAPEALTAADMPALLAALRPMLRTLIGAERAVAVLDKLTKATTS
jgi:hypothetical protein